MVTNGHTAGETPSLEQRWAEHEMLLEVLQMLNWGGVEFYFEPPDGEDEPGTLYIEARAVPPHQWDEPRGQRRTSVTVVPFRVTYGPPQLVTERRRQEAEAAAGAEAESKD